MNTGNITAKTLRRKGKLQFLRLFDENTYYIHLIAITLWAELSPTTRTHHLVHQIGTK